MHNGIKEQDPCLTSQGTLRALQPVKGNMGKGEFKMLSRDAYPSRWLRYEDGRVSYSEHCGSMGHCRHQNRSTPCNTQI